MYLNDVMKTQSTPFSFDYSYLGTVDYLMNPHKYARNEWVRRNGEPKTVNEINACALYVISQQPKPIGGICNIL